MKNKYLRKITSAISFSVFLTLNTTVVYAKDYNVEDTSILYSSLDETVKGADIYNSKENGTAIMNQMVGNNKKYKITNVRDIYYSKAIEDKIVEFTNKFREENGLEPLKNSEVLRFSSRYKNASMFKYDYFEHSNPNMDGCSAGGLSSKLGCDNWNAYGENIYEMSTSRDINSIDVSAYAIFNAWKDSAGHRTNMLQDYYTYIGVSVSIFQRDGVSYIFSTQHFFGDEDSGEPINDQIVINSKSSENENKPIEDDNKDIEEDENKTTEDNNKDIEEDENKPAEDNNKDIEEDENKPAEDNNKDIEEDENKTTEDNNKDIEEDENKPAEDNNKDLETDKNKPYQDKGDKESTKGEENSKPSNNATKNEDKIPSNNTNKAPTTGDEANILAILSLAGASLVIFKALSRKKNINF
ncbi:MAG: CAP domain-containing protein [Clostridiales bacterium]|nr:CAP domain-containing protein [Clostridiales bacterium]